MINAIFINTIFLLPSAKLAKTAPSKGKMLYQPTQARLVQTVKIMAKVMPAIRLYFLVLYFSFRSIKKKVISLKISQPAVIAPISADGFMDITKR